MKYKELQETLLIEKTKNIQLRLKAGEAFKKALNDPNLSAGGGKTIEDKEIIVLEDDEALDAFMDRIGETETTVGLVLQ